MIMINTGNGKGKTTAAIGQIVRSLGRGWKVCLIQLFKGKEFYGEQKILARLPGLDFRSFAPRHPFCFPNVTRERACKGCADAMDFFRRVATGRKRYRLIVLEEFNIALREGYIELEELLAIIDLLGESTHVLITGRGAPKQLIQKADLVTEMKDIKHPFQTGRRAQKGIEF